MSQDSTTSLPTKSAQMSTLMTMVNHSAMVPKLSLSLPKAVDLSQIIHQLPANTTMKPLMLTLNTRLKLLSSIMRQDQTIFHLIETSRVLMLALMTMM